MSDVFVVPRAANHFDRLVVDVPRLFADFPLATRAAWKCGAAASPRGLYRTPILPRQARLAAWKLLHRLRLDTRWLDTFQAYWTSVLRGRPLLSPDDFHFLRGVYRLRHQDNQVPDSDDPRVHVAAWQQPELLYQLFSQVNHESLEPRLSAARWLATIGARSFCEYGCATAPVAWAYSQFFGEPRQAYLIDLPTIALHYAAFRFRRSAAFQPVALDPASRLLPPAGIKVDAIVCVTVFEHLLDPLKVAHHFIDMLNPGGHLIFDYFEGAGEGLDTRQGVDQRPDVLALIRERFVVVSGGPSDPATGGLTVVRLK